MQDGVSHCYLPNNQTIKSVALLNLSDHLFVGNTLYDYSKEREIVEAESDEKIRMLPFIYLQSQISLYRSKGIVLKRIIPFEK